MKVDKNKKLEDRVPGKVIKGKTIVAFTEKKTVFVPVIKGK